ILKRQLISIVFSYDWDREISTINEDYYKWTQWIFIKLYEKGLAYMEEVPVNWCPALGTVLANEEVIDGKSERGGHPVYRKPMKQWMLKITAYADRLLDDLEDVDWPEHIKDMQRNWIGKSVGTNITFKVKDTDESFETFTTRPDTLFGTSYVVLSPESDLIEKIVSADQKSTVDAYIEESSKKSELERTDLNKDKTGVFTGAYAINPANGSDIQIWVADYVIATYGTGAVMGSAAHDERDHAFAKKYDLPIIPVLEGGNTDEEAFTGDGPHINSDFLNDLNTEEAIEKMNDFLEENKSGERKTTYRL